MSKPRADNVSPVAVCKSETFQQGRLKKISLTADELFVLKLIFYQVVQRHVTAFPYPQ